LLDLVSMPPGLFISGYDPRAAALDDAVRYGCRERKLRQEGSVNVYSPDFMRLLIARCVASPGSERRTGIRVSWRSGSPEH